MQRQGGCPFEFPSPGRLRAPLQIRSTSLSSPIHPRSLPYKLDNLTGKVVFAENLVTLEGLRATHGQTVWEAQGRCLCQADSWTLDFSRLIADNVHIDRELLSALPASLAPQVSRLQLRGPVDIDGRMILRGGNSPSGPRLYSFTLRTGPSQATQASERIA